MTLGHTSDRLCAAGGLSGATVIDSLDTLYLMELKEEFQEAKAWVEENFHLNVVSQSPSGCEVQKRPLEVNGRLLVTSETQSCGGSGLRLHSRVAPDLGL